MRHKIGKKTAVLMLVGGLLAANMIADELNASKTANIAFLTDEVLISIPPVYSLALGLSEGTYIQPELLLTNGASPHSYSLKPSDVEKIEKAKLIVIVDEHLEGFLQKALADKRDKVLELSKVAGVRTYPLRTAHHHHAENDAEKAGEHGHEHEHEHENNGHSLSEIDEHIWADTDNAKAIVNALAEVLVKMYPESSDKYNENKQKLFARLDALQEKQRAELSEVKDEPFLVYHDGWQYFEKQNGLRGVGSVVLDEDIMQSVRGRIALADKVKKLQVKCLFTEPQFDSKAVKSLATDLGLKTAEIDLLGYDMSKDENLYFDLMLQNTDKIKNCLK